MANLPKISKFLLFHIIWLAIPVFALSACSDIVCLAGLCPSEKEVATKISWNPQLLAHQNCPDISGKYKARTFEDKSGYHELQQEFPQHDRLGFIQVDIKDNPDGDRFLYSTQINDYVLIEKTEQNLMISRIWPKGNLFRKVTFGLNSPMIGCASGDFIIRDVDVHGGPEGSPNGSVIATERRFKKLADGSLQVTEYTRAWIYNMAFGFKGDPDERRYTRIYSAIS